MARTKLTLQDVARVASERNGGKGGRALQRIAKSKGLTLSYATVDRILAGKYESTPQRPTIEALAVLAEMPVEEVYAAAGLPLPMASLAEALPEGADQLTVYQRRVVLDVIRGFIRDNRRIDDLEEALEHAPLHPTEIVRRIASLRPADLSDDDLEWWFSKLVLTDLVGSDEQRPIHRFFEAVEHELRERELARTGQATSEDLGRPDLAALEPTSGRAVQRRPVEDPAQSDGVTPLGERRRSKKDSGERLSDRRPTLLDDNGVDEDILELPYAADDSEDPGEDDD